MVGIPPRARYFLLPLHTFFGDDWAEDEYAGVLNSHQPIGLRIQDIFNIIKESFRIVLRCIGRGKNINERDAFRGVNDIYIPMR